MREEGVKEGEVECKDETRKGVMKAILGSITDVDTATATIQICHYQSHPSTLNTFCQLGLEASTSHTTASLAFAAVVVGTAPAPSKPVPGSGSTTSLANANPPPTCSSTRAIATVPLSRALPPERTTSSCNHAARCTSTIDICSPANGKRKRDEVNPLYLA
jgi:hypothetical protein